MKKNNKELPIYETYKKVVLNWEDKELKFELFCHLWNIFKSYCNGLLFKMGIDNFDLSEYYSDVYEMVMKNIDIIKNGKTELDIIKFISLFLSSSRNFLRSKIRFYFNNGQRVLTISQNNLNITACHSDIDFNTGETNYFNEYKFKCVLDTVTKEQKEIMIHLLSGLTLQEIAHTMKMQYSKIYYLYKNIKQNKLAKNIYLDLN